MKILKYRIHKFTCITFIIYFNFLNFSVSFQKSQITLRNTTGSAFLFRWVDCWISEIDRWSLGPVCPCFPFAFAGAPRHSRHSWRSTWRITGCSLLLEYKRSHHPYFINPLAHKLYTLPGVRLHFHQSHFLMSPIPHYQAFSLLNIS